MLFQNEFLLAGRQFVQLTSLHPTPPQIFQLWQIFLDRFNPLVKLFHAPSVQKMIMEVASDVENAPNSQIALMFAIYLAAVTSSDEKTCQKIFFETKPRLVTRFANAARQALVNVEFLRSTNLIVLQALTIYLVSRRSLKSNWHFTNHQLQAGHSAKSRSPITMAVIGGSYSYWPSDGPSPRG